MMNPETQIEVVNPDVLYQADKAAVDSQIATAKQYPRQIMHAVDNMLATVTMSDKVARTCSYALPRGGKPITGPSIHLAKIIAQEWGNIRIGSRVVAVNEKDIVCEGICWDLEKNIAIQVSVKRRITSSKGQRFNDDMITVTGNAGNAIAMRNAILAVVPQAVVSRVYDAAIEKITGDLSDETKLTAKRTKLFNHMKEAYKVTEDEILAAIGKESISYVGKDEIALLIGLWQAIKDGDATIEDTFRQEKKKATAAQREKMMKDKELKNIMAGIERCNTLPELEELREQVVNSQSKYMEDLLKLVDGAAEKMIDKGSN